MGRGNYCPSGELTDKWYIDYDGYVWDDDEHEEWERDYELLEEDVCQIIEAIEKRFPSFSSIDTWGSNYWGEHFRLENKFFRIGTADNEWSQAVFIQMKDNLWPEEVNLASRHFQTYCDGIMSIMLDTLGEISLRCGAWCSRTVKKGEALAV